MTEHVLIRHNVEDFDKWYGLFLEHETVRKENGVNHTNVFVVPDDSGEVVVHFMLDDKEKFEAFMNSSDLQQVMKDTGVKTAPVLYVNHT